METPKSLDEFIIDFQKDIQQLKLELVQKDFRIKELEEKLTEAERKIKVLKNRNKATQQLP